MKPFFISTSIPYVNARPHVGHAQEFVLADIIARYRRQKGGDVFFLSGTDENALKNVQAAEDAGVSVQEWVGDNADNFKKLIKAFTISNDDFIQTASDPRHISGAQKLWKALKEGDVYRKKYKGLYCVGCEEFKTERDLAGGECDEHYGKVLEEIEEDNYFFRLSAYEEEIRKHIDSNELRIIPDSRRNEILRFIDGGLEDFSISRSRERAKNWGVPVPGDPTQIMYVWVDALSNYINALDYGGDGVQFEKYWDNGETMHVIGKGINRFHSIYWPALLLSAGIKIPDTVFVHGYITTGGQKMSKSFGNVIDPTEIIKTYGADALRYFLIREIPTFEDGDFTEERFKEAYNANLVNGLGNLVSRVMKMAETHTVKASEESGLLGAQKEYALYLDNFELQKAMHVIWSYIALLDKKIQETEPFKTIKTEPEKAKKDIASLVAGVDGIAEMLIPFLPETAEKIKKSVGENKMPEPLFPRK